MSSETSGSTSPTAAPAAPSGRLVVAGIDGALSRAVLRAARERHDLDAVIPAMRAPGAGDGTGEATGIGTTPEALAPARVVVFVGLSTDLGLDLALGRERRRTWLVEATRAAVTWALAGADGRPARLIALTSARVYGALPDNPVPLPEDAPLRAVDDGGLVGDLLAVEAELAAARAAHPELPLTILRSAAVVGGGADTTITRHFSGRPLVLAGTNPRWQFAHPDDVAAAALALADHDGPVPGVATVGAPGSLTQHEVERLLRTRGIEVSRTAAQRAAERLHTLGRLTTSGADLAYVGDPWIVDAATPVRLGWAPRHDNEACVRALRADLDERPGSIVGRREAALGTASAAVALAASAALIRRSRRRS